MSVSYGLYLPQLRMSFATIERRVRTAEEAGFSSAWLMDHLAPPGMPEADCFEAWTLTAALAVRTEAIRLGHLVGCNPFRHPSVLAKMAATVDVLSGGRLDLGLGWGSVEEELRTYGFDPAPPVRRAAQLEETLEALGLLLSGDPVTYQGEHVQLEGATCRPVPVQQRIPLHVGGGGEQLTMPIVARYADWWNCPSYAVDRLEDLLPRAGTARVSVQHPVGLVLDPARRAEVESIADRRFGSWGGLLCGTPDEIAEALAREVALGVEHIIVQLSDFGEPDTIRAFADEVIPAVQASCSATTTTTAAQ
jgi:alkanesulfonate monooxygenase SsuD/methylene tetrahydromethanopterin reductase-like flavin-dependent oxidoreductase (luciferase family)